MNFCKFSLFTKQQSFMAKHPQYSMTTVSKYLAEAPDAVNAYITDLEKQIK